MSNRKSNEWRVARLGLSGLVGAMAFALAGSASGDDLPLVLSNDNVGMSGSEIEASQGGSTPEAATPEAADVSHEEPAHHAECTHAVHTGVTSYEHCVETSIRGGAAFEASSQVCRVLFPEKS